MAVSTFRSAFGDSTVFHLTVLTKLDPQAHVDDCGCIHGVKIQGSYVLCILRLRWLNRPPVIMSIPIGLSTFCR